MTMLLLVARTSALIAAIGSAAAAPQARPSFAHLADWRITYTVSGGIAGAARAISVNRAGDLSADEHIRGQHVATRAGRDLLALIDGYLARARTVVKRAPERGADIMRATLILESRGRRYELEPTSELANALEKAWAAAITSALVGTWRESQWTLCQPAARLAPADIDATIDELVFRADGTYSITWQGGGARTTDVPHATIPDLTGRYTARPQTGGIEFTHEDAGVFHPSDFSGTGTFQVAGGQLTIKNVWFGTRRAAHRPDICALTFVRR